jgi:FixJ family two-component response regulator
MSRNPTDPAIVHIIDDDESLLQALHRLVRSVGLDARTYGSVSEFTDSDALNAPGCLVLDVRLPGIDGLDFQGQLGERGIHLPVVLMTGHGDIPMTVRAMKAGAIDFLPKPFRDQDMLDAVASAINRDRNRRATEHQTAEINDHFASLSMRERQVMLMATSGMMNKQIAADLGISEITVKIHRGSAMRKMGARTFADLVRMADALAPAMKAG